MDTLIVEHRQEYQHTLGSILQESGSKVWVASSADKAMELMDHHFDLGVIDAGLPGSPAPMDLARKLKCEHPECELVFVDGAPSNTDFDRYREMGVYFLLREPVDVPGFRMCLHNLKRLLSLAEEIACLKSRLGTTEARSILDARSLKLDSSQHLVDDLWIEIFLKLKKNPRHRSDSES